MPAGTRRSTAIARAASAVREHRPGTHGHQRAQEVRRRHARLPVPTRRDPVRLGRSQGHRQGVIKLKGYSIEQRKRYESAYPNLIYTNGVDFEFIREGEPVHFVSIADFLMGAAAESGEVRRAGAAAQAVRRTETDQHPLSAKLAEMMAAKAAIIKDEMESR